MHDAGREQTQEDADAEFPRRHPVRPTVIIGIVALLVLVIAGGFAVVHTLQGGIFSPAPTPTLMPGSDLFYIELSPLWGSISIDGQTLAHLPNPATSPPLKLSIGVHQVIWHPDPFLSQRCTIIVPPNPTGTNCLSNDTLPARGEKGVNAWIITFSLSLTNLSDAQRAALVHAAQADLDSLQSSEMMQPGEQFVTLQASNFIDTATQPLRATLRFQLDADPDSNAPCMGGFGQATNCTGLGQNCHLFCSQLPPSFVGPPQRWDVYAPVRSVWDYRTLGASSSRRTSQLSLTIPAPNTWYHSRLRGMARTGMSQPILLRANTRFLVSILPV